MIICEEMQKLRDALDKMGVEWVDASDEWKIGEYDTCISFFTFAGHTLTTTGNVTPSSTVLALLVGIISSAKITKIFLK